MSGIQMMVLNSVQSAKVVISNPILYLNATDYSGSGTTWPAETGSDAILVNTPTYTVTSPTYFGFNGTNQIAYTANLKANFAVSNSRTLEIWVRTVSDNGVIISEQGTSPINSGYHLSVMEIVSGTLKVGLWNGNGITSTTVGSVARNEWQQYVLTYNDITNTLTGYINAASAATAIVENDSPTPEWYYALCQADFTNMGDGSGLAAEIGLFRVWNTALTAQQVQEIYNENVLRFLPVLYLDANNYAGSGSTWDANQGPDAELVNSPTYVAANPTYFYFNGVDQYAELLHNSVLKPTAAITMEQWITADDWTAGDSVNFLASLSCTQGGGYAHYIWSGTLRSYVRVGSSYQIPTADVSAFAPGSWHHVVTTFDGRYTRLYLDSVLVDTLDLGTSGNTIGYDPDNSLLIAAEATGTTGAAGQYWAGQVGLTRLWNISLTSQQVQQLYDDNAPRFKIVTENLVIDLDASNPVSYPGTGTTWTNLVDDTAYTITNGSYDSANGGSIVFDGASTFVAIGAPLSNGSNFTKEAWVNANVVTGSRNILSSANNVFWNNSSTLSGGVGGSFTLVTSPNFPAQQWQHVVLTFDDAANTMTLYINGTQVTQNTNVTQSYISEIERVGAHFFNGNPVSFWDGKIAQVRIYNTALSEPQVLQNFNATRTTYGL